MNRNWRIQHLSSNVRYMVGGPVLPPLLNVSFKFGFCIQGQPFLLHYVNRQCYIFSESSHSDLRYDILIIQF